jgi:hypothetical protein
VRFGHEEQSHVVSTLIAVLSTLLALFSCPHLQFNTFASSPPPPLFRILHATSLLHLPHHNPAHLPMTHKPAHLPTCSISETIAPGNRFYDVPPALVGKPSPDPSSRIYYEALSERREHLFGGLCRTHVCLLV